jgi:hypothetical protein
VTIVELVVVFVAVVAVDGGIVDVSTECVIHPHKVVLLVLLCLLQLHDGLLIVLAMVVIRHICPRSRRVESKSLG